MAKLPRLPIGQQSFEVLRKDQAVYVDKTEHIHRLVDQGSYYFLSRPRRFGKSLLVSTLKCLFEGRKDLFEGLWIVQKQRWVWEEHPVLLIDFSGIRLSTTEDLKGGLNTRILRIAKHYQIKLQTSHFQDSFQELILELYNKTGKPVVVLVDEYDKPIVEHLGKGEPAIEIAKANREILKQFYGCLKDGEVASCLRFVFLTGVSKFSRVSIFSELNNLSDLTMSKPYADLCGYTEEELNNNFSEHLEALRQEFNWTWEELHQQLAVHYNGYRFTSKAVSVYNPFSILNIFSDLELKDYWFESGSPSFLVNLIYERQFDLPQLDSLQLEAKQFSTYNLENLNLTALLFQTGYLTIKDYDGTYYTLSYPNQEVHTGFIGSLWETYSGLSNTLPYRQLSTTLENEQFEAFFENIQTTFAQIPYTLGANQHENYYHTIFFLLLSSTGILARNEVLTSLGRIDMVVEFSDKVFIFEFKCNQSADAAIQQIKTKGYATPYQKTRKPITLVGIDFNTELRNIAEWKVESGP